MSAPWIVLQVAFLLALLAIVLFLSGLAKRVLVVLEAAEGKLGGSLNMDPGGLEIGQRVPEFRAALAGGRTIDRQSLVDMNRVLLFLSAACPPCERLANELIGSSPEVRSSVVVVVSEHDQSLSFPDEVVMFREKGRSLSDAFQNAATPRAYALDLNGVVVERTIPRSMADVIHTVNHGREKRGGARSIPEATQADLG